MTVPATQPPLDASDEDDQAESGQDDADHGDSLFARAGCVAENQPADWREDGTKPDHVEAVHGDLLPGPDSIAEADMVPRVEVDRANARARRAADAEHMARMDADALRLEVGRLRGQLASVRNVDRKRRASAQGELPIGASREELQRGLERLTRKHEEVVDVLKKIASHFDVGTGDLGRCAGETVKRFEDYARATATAALERAARACCGRTPALPCR